MNADGFVWIGMAFVIALMFHTLRQFLQKKKNGR